MDSTTISDTTDDIRDRLLQDILLAPIASNLREQLVTTLEAGGDPIKIRAELTRLVSGVEADTKPEKFGTPRKWGTPGWKMGGPAPTNTTATEEPPKAE